MTFKSKTTPRVPQLTSWSYSRYSDWRQCPLKAKLKHIDRIKEPSNSAMERGNAIHKGAEAYIKSEVPATALMAELKLFKDEFKKLRALYKKKALPMVVEDNWAFTADWTETQWDDWVGCWVRIKLDAAHYVADNVMVVTDWKSGKPNAYKKVEYEEQLELYALAALLLHEHLERVHVRIGWTDVGQMMGPTDANGAEVVYTRAHITLLRKKWNARVKPMMADTTFVPKPNAMCRYCWFGQAKKAEGGPGICKF